MWGKKQIFIKIRQMISRAPPSQVSPPISNISMGPMSMAPARVIHVDQDITPRQKAFIDDVTARGAMLVTATFDRVAQNQKELTVNRGEYLEVCG